MAQIKDSSNSNVKTSSWGCFASTKSSSKAVLEIASQNKPALISKAKEKHHMSSVPADLLALASGFRPCDANFPKPPPAISRAGGGCKVIQSTSTRQIMLLIFPKET